MDAPLTVIDWSSLSPEELLHLRSVGVANFLRHSRLESVSVPQISVDGTHRMLFAMRIIPDLLSGHEKAAPGTLGRDLDHLFNSAADLDSRSVGEGDRVSNDPVSGAAQCGLLTLPEPLSAFLAWWQPAPASQVAA